MDNMIMTPDKYSTDEILSFMKDTSEAVKEQRTRDTVSILAAAGQADKLTDNVEFWRWFGENYHNKYATAAQRQELHSALSSTTLRGKAYEWDFMSNQRHSLNKLFSRFDAGIDPTQKGIDITETNLLSGKVTTYQNKAYNKKVPLSVLKTTPKESIVVTCADDTTAIEEAGYTVQKFKDSKSITTRTNKLYKQAKNGFAEGTYTLGNVAGTMAMAGAIGAVIGVTSEALFSYRKWKNGELTTKEYLIEITKSGAQTGIISAATAGIMIPINAAITAAGCSTLIGIPIAFLVGAAIEKVVKPAFGRGDYEILLKEAKFYSSVTDMYIPLIEEMNRSAYIFESFVDTITSQNRQFIETSDLNRQLNICQSRANEILMDKSDINALNELIAKI